MRRNKLEKLTKTQLADVLTMDIKTYVKKYKTSVSSHQRLKLAVLSDVKLFNKSGVEIKDVTYRSGAMKIIKCLEHLKRFKGYPITGIFTENEKENVVEVPSTTKRRGRPKGSKNKSFITKEEFIKNNNIEEKIEVEEIVKETIEKIVEEKQETVSEVEIIKDEDIQKVEVQKKPNLYDMLKDSNMGFFAEFLENISSLDDLVNLGIENYFNKTIATNEKITQIFNDLYHIIEFEDVEDNQIKIQRYDALKMNLIQRRRFKDEFSFLKENKSLLISFCTVFKRAKMFNEKKENRCYTFRQIGQEVGLTGLSKGKDPENLKVEERMIELERVRIKRDREEKRRNQQIVPIDKIEKNWKELFHNELDTYTRTELYKEASNIYKEKDYLTNFNMLKEYIIEMEIMPELLYNKGYFLIDKK